MIKIKKILQNGKGLWLSYDTGLEQGPVNFNIHNVDPNYVIHIGVFGKYDGLILNKGVAEAYRDNYRRKIPLILKLNGRTNIPRIFPIAKLNCSVKKAVELGADAVGYTIYVGSALEPEIFSEFGKVQEEAHDYNLPVVLWLLPKGRYVTSELSTSMLAYASRIGLELGGDILCMDYNEHKEEFKWVMKCGGGLPFIVRDNVRLNERELFRKVEDIVDAGANGYIAEQSVFSHAEPMKVSVALRKIIFDGISAKKALEIVK